ncbi:MAG: Gfo/Idh/MocA family oxidoreductase [Candidatus Lernaella stagnicola]|nr:Gfo/Idh/MocA family oxidoreductase [Candidatus Lernaella stagnicola]
MRARVAVIGAGYWGPNLIRNLYAVDPDCVSFICDRNQTRLDHLREHYPTLRMTTSIDEVLADADTDAVMLALPPVLHHDTALRALEAGKHLFVEKPLALSVEEAAEVVDAAVRARRQLMVGLVYRFNPMIDRILDVIDAGWLGEITRVYSRRTNLNLREKNSNIIWMLAPHDVSILRHWFGHTPRVESVTAQRIEHEDFEDQAQVRLTVGGVRADLYMSWLDPVKTRRIVVIGTQGLLVYDETHSATAIKLYRNPTPGRELDYPIDQLEMMVRGLGAPFTAVHGDQTPIEPLAHEVQHFLSCLRTGNAPLTNGREALEVTQVIQTIMERLRGTTHAA